MATKADIAAAVLSRLGVLGAGQTPSGNDQNMVEKLVESQHQKLQRRGLAPYEIESVPEWAEDDLADFIAPKCATLFRISPEQTQSLLLLRNEAFRSMSRETSGGYMGRQMETKAY